MSNDIYAHLTQEDYDTEEWRDIQDYPDYQVSSLGRVRSMKNGLVRIMKPSESFGGYFRVKLCEAGEQRKFLIHRLVAVAFIENQLNLPQVNHKSGIKSDNTAKNLEWVTASENLEHARLNGLRNDVGESNGNCKLTDIECIEIIKKYRTGKYYQKDLAEMYGVTPTNISLLTRGKSRTYLNV